MVKVDNCKQLEDYAIKIKDEMHKNKAIISNCCFFPYGIEISNLDSVLIAYPGLAILLML